MKITMIGAGYVGLVSGVCFAELGHEVVCVDVDETRVSKLKDGISPIYEPGLEEMMKRNVAEDRLHFSADLSTAAKDASAIFIAVGTPTRRGDGHADLTYVYAAAREIAQKADPGTVVVTKSTVPVGTNAEIARILEQERPGAGLMVASNPEFLREGSAIGDFMKPDRVVVGTESEAARNVMASIYAALGDAGAPVVFTGIETAEMIKYGANAFLATRITFINEMARLCERVGADISAVAHGMGLDDRIGPRFLRAGPGYGGSCFPKDTKALAQIGRDNGQQMSIVEAVIDANEDMKLAMVDKVRDLCDGDLEGKRIAVLGVTFKAETDDMRDAPSLTILPALDTMGAEIVICDPQGAREGVAAFPFADWAEDAYTAAQDADAVVILTEWRCFKDLDLERLAISMRTPRMADLRNLYSGAEARAAGFEDYEGVGRR